MGEDLCRDLKLRVGSAASGLQGLQANQLHALVRNPERCQGRNHGEAPAELVMGEYLCGYLWILVLGQHKSKRVFAQVLQHTPRMGHKLLLCKGILTRQN